MRVAKTNDGRYVKILSPEMQGLIGRLYLEINERKTRDEEVELALEKKDRLTDLINARLETMNLRYNEVVSLLRQLFPENETMAIIDRPLKVDGTIKATALELTEAVFPPLKVLSKAMVTNLNAEYLGGMKVADIQKEIDADVAALKVFLEEAATNSESRYYRDFVEIEHKGSNGLDQHALATQSVAGFMSDVDKKYLDDVRRDNPGGMYVSRDAPQAPRMNQIWVDLS